MDNYRSRLWGLADDQAAGSPTAATHQIAGTERMSGKTNYPQPVVESASEVNRRSDEIGHEHPIFLSAWSVRNCLRAAQRAAVVTETFDELMIANDRRLIALRSYLLAHPARLITLEEASAAAALEYHYFSRYFKERVGLTFSQWQMQHRMRSAANALRLNGSLAMSIAAHIAGYEDPTAFSRAFKRVLGMSPRKYRQCHAENHKSGRQAVNEFG